MHPVTGGMLHYSVSLLDIKLSLQGTGEQYKIASKMG